MTNFNGTRVSRARYNKQQPLVKVKRVMIQLPAEDGSMTEKSRFRVTVGFFDKLVDHAVAVALKHRTKPVVCALISIAPLKDHN